MDATCARPASLRPGLHRRRADPPFRCSPASSTTCSRRASIPARQQEEGGSGSREAYPGAIADQLAEVPSIDDDRILRSILTVIDATLRTNYFSPDPAGRRVPRSPSSSIRAPFPTCPIPSPSARSSSTAREVEGVHLRFGPVARGGLRWSDRAQDFRTEVLGLVKAQQVKNAVIVPVGAKGGFVPKRLPPAAAATRSSRRARRLHHRSSRRCSTSPTI
jgi:NAD-specific glutamate dehydrogenase